MPTMDFGLFYSEFFFLFDVLDDITYICGGGVAVVGMYNCCGITCVCV